MMNKHLFVLIIDSQGRQPWTTSSSSWTWQLNIDELGPTKKTNTEREKIG